MVVVVGGGGRVFVVDDVVVEVCVTVVGGDRSALSYPVVVTFAMSTKDGAWVVVATMT